MAEVFGRSYTKQELLARFDDMSQVAGVRPARLEHGPEDGVSVLDVFTGSGLRFTIVPSRGMDISMAEYNGAALAPRGSCRESHPAFLEPGGQGWSRGFMQGLLTTCGPTWETQPPRPHELRVGKHGRATYTPARCISYDERWQRDDYVLSASGRMRQDALLWERTITTALGSKHLTIRDRVENQSIRPANHRFQYHINAGFPVVDDTSYFAASSLGLYDRKGQTLEETFRHMAPPAANAPGAAVDELMVADEDGYAMAMIVNPTFQGEAVVGYYVRYRIDTLRHFILWKNLRPGHYIVGTEPASAPPMDPYAPNLATGGILQPMAPGEVREYEIEIGVVDSTARIAELEEQMTATVKRYLADPPAYPDSLGTTCTGTHGH